MHFDALDFESYVHEAVITYTAQGKTKKASLNANTSLIKNFDTIAQPSDTLFDFDCGEYVIIDNNGDGYIDVVTVYAYENAVVSGVYNNLITLKEGFSMGGTRYINLDADDLLFSIVDLNGEYVDANTLSGGSVITVAADKTGNVLRIIAREDAKSTGVLSTVSESGFEFGEECYPILYNADYDIGANYDYYLNFKNDLVFYELSSADNSTKYAYVIGVDSGRMTKNRIYLAVSKQVDFGMEVDDTDADNVTEIPMLICQNQELTIYEMANKVIFNGTRVDSAGIKALVDNSDRLYKFELNSEGQIRSLSAPDYKAGSKYITFTYNVYDKCFGGAGVSFEGFAIDERSQILCIPTGATSDEDYMVKNIINLEGNTIGYNVRAFNFNENTKKCELIVIDREMKSDNLPGVTVNSSKVGIIKSIRTVFADGEEITKIEFAVAGEDKQSPLTRAATQAMSSLKEGDLFVYEENYDGEIANLKKIRSMSELSSSFSQSSSLSSGASEIFGPLEEIRFDEVDRINTSLVMHFIIDVNGYSMTQNVPQRNKPPIYLYDGKGAVRNATIDEFIPGSDSVYVFMGSTTTTSVVVIVRGAR